MSEKSAGSSSTPATLLSLLDSARRVSVPIVAVRTVDQFETTTAIATAMNAFPILQWDAARGITDVNAEGKRAMAHAKIKSEDTVQFPEAMLAAQLLPQAAVLIVLNAHRQLTSMEPAVTATAVQAVANLRDSFKSNHRMLILLSPSLALPAELEHDVVVMDHALPTPDDLRTIITDLHVSAKLDPPDDSKLTRAVDAVSGLSAFAAEQVAAMSMRPAADGGLDIDAAWERTRITIEQTRGLSVYRGKETFADLRGLESVKARLRSHINAKTPVGVVVWIDEGADVFSNVETDTSGNKTDQQRALLVEMEQNNWRGMIGTGVPGSGKSAIARAFGNEAGVPTIAVDFGDMEDKWQGESEAHLRQAIRVIKAVGRGHAFFVLTCNSLKGIRPQFQRRFKRGVFFFDLPTNEERAAIWTLYRQRYQIPAKEKQPDDNGWTGAEIRECCESAWDTGCTLLDAARYIVPVSRSRTREIEDMRIEAHERFLDASHAGTYRYDPEPMKKQVRAIALPPAVANLLPPVPES